MSFLQTVICQISFMLWENNLTDTNEITSCSLVPTIARTEVIGIRMIEVLYLNGNVMCEKIVLQFNNLCTLGNSFLPKKYASGVRSSYIVFMETIFDDINQGGSIKLL